MDDKSLKGDQVKYEQIYNEGIVTDPTDPLALSILDDELCDVVDKRIRDKREFYKGEEYDLYTRRAKLELYRFGRQIIQKEKNRLLKDYESRYLDNVLYEIEATIKPLAMSRMPDLMVLPGNDSDEAKLMAEQVSEMVDTQIKEQENR